MLNTTRFPSVFACFLAIFAISSSAFADGIVAPYGITLGGQAGAGILSDGGGTHFELGLESLYNVFGPISVGAYVDYLSRGSVVDPLNGDTVSASYLLYGGQVMYDTSLIIPGSSVGMRVGLARNARSVQLLSNGSEMNQDDTNFSIGPVVAYDVPLNPEWSAGGEANWQISSGDSVNNVLGLLATLKYHL
jgi:hypothetical protein